MLRAIWLGILFLALAPGSALAARHALVIGINDYVNVPRLEKAVGDADAMAARLRSLGFTVTRVVNPDRRTLNQAIATFTRQVKPGDDVLVHFSGHGVELDGNNLLLPADVPLPDSSDKDFLIGEAISLSDLMQRISDSHAAVKVFVIDACRDNPFATRGRSIGTNRGLSVTEAMEGSFVFYSAGRGQTALDSLGDNDPASTSVYTRVLINALGQPGLSLTDIAKSVRKQVATLAAGVNHEQQPAYYDELNDDGFFFATGGSGGQTAQPGQTEPPPAADTTRDDYVFAQGVDTVQAWTIFLTYHPTGYYADMARAALDKARQREAAIDLPIQTPQAPPPTQSTGRNLAIYNDLDFYGADISMNRVADPIVCANTCLHTDQCVAFTFNGDPKAKKGPNCILKKGTGEPQPYRFASSGVFFDKDDAPPVMHGFAIDPDYDVVEDTDITGYDLFPNPVSGANTVAKCRQECLEDGRCKAFSFAEKVRQCWLKDVVGPKTYRINVTTGFKSAITQQASKTYPITR